MIRILTYVLFVIHNLVYSHVYKSIKSKYIQFYMDGFLYYKKVLFIPGTVRFLGFPKFMIRDNSHVIIGEGFVCNSGFGEVGTCKSVLSVNEKAVLEIGRNVGISNAEIYCHKSIVIEDNVKIGSGTWIMDTDFHSIDNYKRRNSNTDSINAKCLPVIIKEDAFIGAHSIITKGVTIGARSIIAAGSIVVKSIPDDCIAGGNPCRIIKQNTNG